MLQATGLECVRGGRRLFRELSFSLEKGALLRVAGENGSGKTSLLRILCGLLEPRAGEVRWEGEPIARLREEYSRRLVYLGHAGAVKDELTAAENLEIACTLAGLSTGGKEIGEALSRFGLPQAPVPLKRLSQGQRRRAALARLALSAEVPLWLLDEPFAALDPAAAQAVESLMAEHAARGGMVVYTTHQPAGLDASAAVLDLARAAVADLGARA